MNEASCYLEQHDTISKKMEKKMRKDSMTKPEIKELEGLQIEITQASGLGKTPHIAV